MLRSRLHQSSATECIISVARITIWGEMMNAVVHRSAMIDKIAISRKKRFIFLSLSHHSKLSLVVIIDRFRLVFF